MAKKKETKKAVTPEVQDVPEVDLNNWIADPRNRLKSVAIIMGILVAGTLATCGVATLFGDDEEYGVIPEPEIPVVESPPMAPVLAVLEEVVVVLEEVVVTPEEVVEPEEVVLEPPEVPSYGVAPGFDCAFIIGSWSDAILLDAQTRECDVIEVGYLGDIVYYYDVGFNLMQDISHRYH